MAVLRKEKKENFTVIDNAIFKDYEISYKAKGLLCQMLSLPDEWEYSIEGLAKLSNDGVSAVRSALDELKEAGYFRREQVRKDGKIAKIEYVISETKKCENLVVENLKQENLKQENRRQLNTKELNTDKSNIKEYTSEFENLWKLYPKKQGKESAKKSYIRARKEGATYEQVLAGMNAYINYINKTNTQSKYIKYGSTFFNQKAWEDDWTVDTGYSSSSGRSKNPFTQMLESGEFL